ncbi:uncharacterized protein K460DRAFT_410975 [Cucurbitaria berberidis CBS 394.84]|uniref:Uncharacterized protein n=1 Tax=Cucurbitaria berberidis CBS 394.84 TaxID=1168544 RepID=A0A9P4G7X3_9PLEO|nr:uncharacterized protein K460DRAFT_410975 [Cucurbitaria berberidis CBS 394.84]KAF1840384.1 hypothetical protein K460DRAFT_410975 [Cucurbitaria berberidis CBS 394.84]
MFDSVMVPLFDAVYLTVAGPRSYEAQPPIQIFCVLLDLALPFSNLLAEPRGAMNPRTSRATPFQEPSVIVKIDHIEVEEDLPVVQMTDPPRSPTKRRVLDVASRTFRRPFKRRRTSKHSAEESVDLSCPLPQEDLHTARPLRLTAADSSEESSVVDINEVPSEITPADQAPPSSEGSRRKTSLVDRFKNIGNVADLFRRKDSVMTPGCPPEIGSPGIQSRGALEISHDNDQAWYTTADNGAMAFEGMAHFPNVSQFFSQRRITGESSIWYTTDEYLSWQDSFLETIKTTPATSLEANAEDRRWHNLTGYSPEPSSAREQSPQKSLVKNVFDLVFSWLSKRPSEKSQGKQPRLQDDLPPSPPLSSRDSLFPEITVRLAAPEGTPSSAIHPLTTLASVIPPMYNEDWTVVVGRNSLAIPEASCSSSDSSVPSRTLPLPRPDSRASNPIPATLPNDHHLAAPPPGRPHVRPYSSNESFGDSSTSLSSYGDSNLIAQPTGSVHQAVPNGAAASSSNAGAEGRSLPVDIPSSNNNNHRSSTYPEVTARPSEYHYLPSRTVFRVIDGSEASMRSYGRHGDRPGTPPLSSYHRHTIIPSSSTMQTPDLPSSQRPAVHRREISGELIFRMSAPPSPEDLTHSEPPWAAQRQLRMVVDEQHRPPGILAHQGSPEQSLSVRRELRRSRDDRLRPNWWTNALQGYEMQYGTLAADDSDAS